jgi:hypothetical protein
LSHDPQLLGSVLVSTQVPAQQSFEGGHDPFPQLHVPAMHSSLAEQTVPQAPQLLGSVWVSVQVPPQQLLMDVHVAPLQLHAPATQVSPAEQIVPHAPQFFGSVLVSEQVPLHFCWHCGQSQQRHDSI